MKTRLAVFFLALAALAPASTLRADDLLPADRPIEEATDHYLDASLKEANVKPASQADDATLLRRLTLDLNGRIPTVAELRDYLAAGPDKRLKLVERLLNSSAFARHQATEFEALLNGSLRDNPNKRGRGPGSLGNYLQTAFAENRPWDRIFRELILADERDPKLKGAADFLRPRLKDLDRLTSEVSSIFFGVNISCAQCHDHPLVQDWKQDHFYGMKSFFARSFEKGTVVDERPNGVVKYTPNKGKEKTAPVMFLTSKTVEPPGPKDAAKISLRAKLVDLALEPDQRHFFARAIVNRVWYRLFGQGLVMPLDQMHSENPPSHPELLDWLARDLVEHGYDLRRLTRGLVLSQAYSRSSRWDGERMPSAKLFAVAQVRPLTPQQLATSLRLAALDPESLPTAGPELEKRLEAIEKSASSLANLFAPTGDSFQVGVQEALLFSNGQALIKECLEDGNGRVVGRLKGVADLEKRADLAVRVVLARPARSEEIAALSEYLRKRADRPVAACQQVVWALLASAEFRYNH